MLTPLPSIASAGTDSHQTPPNSPKPFHTSSAQNTGTNVLLDAEETQLASLLAEMTTLAVPKTQLESMLPPHLPARLQQLFRPVLLLVDQLAWFTPVSEELLQLQRHQQAQTKRAVRMLPWILDGATVSLSYSPAFSLGLLWSCKTNGHLDHLVTHWDEDI